MDVFEEFQWRGLVFDATQGLREKLARDKITAYIGFDPTASSLHAGNLLTIMGLVRLQRYGHTSIAVPGGGTGLIGDPSGKTTERKLLSKDEVLANVEAIKEQLSRFLDFEHIVNPAKMVNNADWLCTISVTDFLRDVGKHFSVNNLIAKESIKRRMEQEGISYTEFSYILLQSYDYLMLYEKYNCTLQMGGSDQWGNITSGIDLIRRIHGVQAHALVWPLLTTASGAKFGKTESGAIWLDSKRTSPYRFFQYWLNTEDTDVVSRLKQFTLLSQEEIEEVSQSVASHPEKREAQRKLAREITRAVHGQQELDKAEKASRVLFGESIQGLGVQDVLDIFSEVPSVQITSDLLTGDRTTAVDLVTTSGLVQSKAEAKRLIQGGGVSLNNIKIKDSKQIVSLQDAIEGKALILRKGQKDYCLVKVV